MTYPIFRALRKFAATSALIMIGSPALAESPSYKIDKNSGLIMAPGWKLVNGHCAACHSAKFVTSQRGDRETWLATIRWMQKTQGLWALPPKTEEIILDYLATYYPPGKPSRRANLSPSLMPETK